MEQFQEFVASPAGLAVKGMMGLAFLNFLVGSYAAIADGSFALSAVSAFIAKHILGRVLPVATVLAGGFFLNDGTLTAAGLAAATVYTLSVVGSLRESIGQVASSPDAAKNPVPIA